jgi:hypothetical protein
MFCILPPFTCLLTFSSACVSILIPIDTSISAHITSLQTSQILPTHTTLNTTPSPNMGSLPSKLPAKSKSLFPPHLCPQPPHPPPKDGVLPPCNTPTSHASPTPPRRNVKDGVLPPCNTPTARNSSTLFFFLPILSLPFPPPHQRPLQAKHFTISSLSFFQSYPAS